MKLEICDLGEYSVSGADHAAETDIFNKEKQKYALKYESSSNQVREILLYISAQVESTFTL